MGKRKSSAKPPPKKARPKLATQFACPFCNADKSVSCELDREANVGAVKCVQCKAAWTTKIHQLSEPIDVYRWAGGERWLAGWPRAWAAGWLVGRAGGVSACRPAAGELWRGG